MEKKMLAPIVVFAYNRPEHLDKTLNALSMCPEAKDSILYIRIDGPKNSSGTEKNREVYAVAQKYSDGYFKHVNILNKEQNSGLAVSVITGVGEIISTFGKVIVTEDDAVCAPSYLRFMNDALDYYENDEMIWSIGGYTLPMKIPDDYSNDLILTQRSSSYAWATWKSRWEKIDWEMKDYRKFRFDFASRRRFNAWGNDRASMLDDQMNGRVNSWAIRFDYAMYKNGMYNVIPCTSLIKNIGHDGSGTHSTVDSGDHDPFRVDLSAVQNDFQMGKIMIDERIRKEFCIPFTATKMQLLKRYLGNLVRSI